MKCADEEVVASVVDAVDYDYWLRNGSLRTNDVV